MCTTRRRRAFPLPTCRTIGRARSAACRRASLHPWRNEIPAAVSGAARDRESGKEEGFVPSSFFASCRGSRKFSGEVLTNRPDLCKIKCAPCAPNVSAGCADKRKARTDIPFRMRCVRDEDCGNSKSGLQFSDRKRWSDRLPGERKAFPDLPSEVFRISYAPVAQLDRASAS